MTLDKSPAEQLATPVQFLKGVGPQRAEVLQRLDLQTARDVLFFFPRTYQDMTDLREVQQLEEDKLQSVCGIVEDMELRGSQPGKCVLGVLIRSGGGHLRGLWFNQPFMEEKFKIGQRVMFAGKPKLQGLVWQMSHPKVDWLGEEDEEPQGRILPVYPLTEGLQQWQMRKIVGRDGRRLRPSAGRDLSRRVSPGPRPLAAACGRSSRSTPPTTPNNWPARGGGWPTRSFSCWGWRWPSGGINSTTCGRPRRWRPRP